MRRLELVALALTAISGCSLRGSPAFPTRTGEPETSARPPGVAVDRAQHLPPADTSSPAERGLAVLTAPHGLAEAEHSLRAFFDAVIAESPAELDAVLDARAWLKSDAASPRQRARSFWRSRFARLDYSELTRQTIYHERDVEIYRAEELSVLGAERRIDVQPLPGDIVMRVPISAGRDRSERLFGETMVLLLRYDEGRFRIVEIQEDFRLP
ncbi:MAG TPA: hypothetical protein VF989_05705 [Polyangiaceae bacterium]|jgi:hypothetical protein